MWLRTRRSFNYVMNRNVTFKSSSNYARSIAMFVAMYCWNLLFSNLMMAWIPGLLGWPTMAVKIVTMVERGAQQRDVQHGIAAQQQSQHPGLIHGPEPFHFPSYIRQRRPVLPLATSFPMRIHCKIACPFSRDRGGKTVRRERHLKMT